MNGVLIVCVSQVCVVRSFFVLFGLVVFRRLVKVIGRPLMMTTSVMIMFPSL
jgi:hypothetical protein